MPSEVPSRSSDLKTLWHLISTRARGENQQQRLESFYQKQAAGYDAFRRRLLHGRDELLSSIDVPMEGIWVDFGAGTGENAERLGSRLSRLRQMYLVDLSPSLLGIAQQRISELGWDNVTAALADATMFTPSEGSADVVSFSYSLTMIPDWFEAIEHARRILKPGGTIAVVDFYVSRKHADNRQHGWLTRNGWPLWFSTDNVFLNPDHLPFLQSRFSMLSLHEATGAIPYLPLVKVPFYRFVGCKPE